MILIQSLQGTKCTLSQEVNNSIPFCFLLALLRGAELFEAKVKKLIAARLELEQKSVETLKKQ